MIEVLNGQTEEIGGGCEERFPDTEQGGLGSIPSQGQLYGVKQGRASSEDRQGGDTTGTSSQSGDSYIDKALQRLDLIESSSLSYIRQAKQELEAHLEEMRLHESHLRKAITELKQELYDLASEQNKLSP